MAAAQDVAFACTCGKVSGTVKGVKPSVVAYSHCYCKGCQTWAHSLGRGDEILDSRGGSHILIFSCARLGFDRGTEELALRRLSPKGAYRWYAKCCNTPIANTAKGNKFGFVGMPSMAWKGSLPDPPDSVLGKHMVVNAHGARPGTEGDPPLKNSSKWSMILLFRKLIGWKLKGDEKRSPLFDAKTGEPMVEAEILTREQRDAIVAKAGL